MTRANLQHFTREQINDNLQKQKNALKKIITIINLSPSISKRLKKIKKLKESKKRVK